MMVLFDNIFSSLKIRNFRLYFTAQVVSLSGTWMQAIALGWLAYEITQSGTSLGIVLALQYLPLLLFGVFGGYISDKLPKYKALFFTQFLYSIAPIIIAYLIFNGGINIWWLYFASLWSGLMRILDNPLRQSFISMVVEKEHIKNAVSLYSTSSNVARIIGPVFAGIVLADYGAGWCFLLNAFTFWFVLIMLYLMDPTKFTKSYSESKKSDLNLRESLQYIWRNYIIRDTLMVAVLFGIFIMTFQTCFPIFAKTVFNRSVDAYSTMISVYGLGAVMGGLYAAQDKVLSKMKVRKISLILGLIYCLLAIAPTFHIFLLLVFVVGFFTIQATTTANSLVRLTTADNHIGLTTALWSMSIIGMGALGSVFMGSMSDLIGVRETVFLGGVLFLVPIYFFYRER